jgi:hypothetical protein
MCLELVEVDSGDHSALWIDDNQDCGPRRINQVLTETIWEKPKCCLASASKASGEGMASMVELALLRCGQDEDS